MFNTLKTDKSKKNRQIKQYDEKICEKCSFPKNTALIKKNITALIKTNT